MRLAGERLLLASLLAVGVLLARPRPAEAERVPAASLLAVPDPNAAGTADLFAASPLSLPGPPRAQPEPPVGWAMLAGAATALVPFAVGASLFASGIDTQRREAGSLVLVSGLALAPIISHLLVREWRRAAIFGAIPIACAIGAATLLALTPTTTIYGTHDGRLTFGLLVSFATLSSAVGVIDTLGAARRATARPPRRALILPLPYAAPTGGGLLVGGIFP